MYQSAFRRSINDGNTEEAEILKHYLPPATAVVVDSAGYKKRVVTKSPVILQAIGHVARRYINAILRDSPGISEELNGDFNADMERFKGADGYVLSTDLKAATDVTPFELSDAFVKALRECKDIIPDIVADATEICTGPMNLYHDKDLYMGDSLGNALKKL